MRPVARKKISLLAVGAVVAISTGLVVTPAASAATRPVDVTGFTAKDMVFASSGCKYNTIKQSRKVASSVEDYLIGTGVTRGGVLQDAFLLDADTSSERVLICDWQGLGAYKIGPSDVVGYTKDFASTFDYTDYTSKTFYARGQSKAAISSARKGKVVTFKLSASYYNPAAYKYSALSAKGVKVQRKTSKGWTTIKTVNLSKGKASFKYTQAAKASYRAVVAQTTKTTAATSATTKR